MAAKKKIEETVQTENLDPADPKISSVLYQRISDAKSMHLIEVLPELSSVMAVLYAAKILNPTKIPSSVSDIKNAFESLTDRAINIVALKLDDINPNDITNDEPEPDPVPKQIVEPKPEEKQ
jgi:uncharacterized protein with PhoU and TrkA domain